MMGSAYAGQSSCRGRCNKPLRHICLHEAGFVNRAVTQTLGGACNEMGPTVSPAYPACMGIASSASIWLLPRYGVHGSVIRRQIALLVSKNSGESNVTFAVFAWHPRARSRLCGT